MTDQRLAARARKAATELELLEPRLKELEQTFSGVPLVSFFLGRCAYFAGRAADGLRKLARTGPDSQVDPPCEGM